MPLEAMIERVRRCTLRPLLSKFGHALGGRNPARLENVLEVVDCWCARCRDCSNQIVNLQPWPCGR